MNATTADILSIADSLPIDTKLELIDKFLESISPSQSEIDELWKVEVERRIDEVESGKLKTIPGGEVFAKIRERFGKRTFHFITKLRQNFSRPSISTKIAKRV